jgi:hypothetical protein
MLRRMQTMTPGEVVSDLVSASFEACSAFADPVDGSPVCEQCGWLDAEHPTAFEGAEVHVLPRRPVRSTPTRIAS